ncbi:MAG TPA: xanthine dehydrogenase family protein, partial [Solirubrobacteraceae bacterium]|nr:xanthine dehydrogenase family protein [Solirubrobacteraceae bacterium]
MATILGKPYVRADGPEKVTGQGRYTADLALPGMLHARFLYAGRAHARILRLDLTRARALPGVFAVLCQDDVPDVRYGPFVKDRTLFARDVVRYEGEIVAAVAALDESSPLVHEAWESYESGDCFVGHNDSGLSTAVKGDAASAMAESDIVVRERYVADTSHPVPIEPHAIVAQWQGERLTVWTTSQVPFMARSGIAETLAMPESRVRVIVPHLGGGFGGKCDFHFEGHVAALARAAKRPVRLLFTRRECFVVPDKARHAIVMDLETGMKADGTLHARRARLYLQSGAYAADSPVLTEIATMMAVGPYRIPHVDVAGHTVYTNTTVAGSTRAPTGPQICWAVEQHTDVLAARAGLDPLEFRRRNLVHEGDEGPTRQVFERIGLLECLENAARDIGWDRPRAEGEGVGLSCGWWFSMPSPSGAFVKLNGDGSGTIITGAEESGTGAVMGLPLLA